MLRMFIAGSDSFVSRIRETSDEYPNIEIAYASFDPQSAVENFERNGPFQALLLGFTDAENKSLLEILMRYSVKTIPFVAVVNIADEWDKWISLKANIVQEGAELKGVWDQLSNIPLPTPAAEKYIPDETSFRMKRVISEKRKNVVTVPRQIVGVYSWKGGVGKSTFLVSILKSINYLTTAKICVLDTDTSRDCSDILMYLGFLPPPEVRCSMITWRSWFKDRRINEESLMKYLFKIKENVYFLPAISSMADKEAFDEDQNLIPEILTVLKRYFDLILVDVGNNLGNAQLLTLDMSDQIFLICEPSICEMATMKKFISDTFPVISSHKNKMSFIYNKAFKEGNYGRNINNQKNFEKFKPAQNAGITCIAELPLDMMVLSNVRQNAYTPFFPVDDTAYTQEMKKVIEKLYPGNLFENGQSAKKMGNWCRMVTGTLKFKKGDFINEQPKPYRT